MKFISRASPTLMLALFMMCLCSLAVYFYSAKLNEIDINYVSVEGNLSPSQHQEILARLATQALHAVPVDEIKVRLERKLWVASVSIERHWPDEIHLRVVPEIAIAIWNDDALINDKGTIFKSDYVDKSLLAELYGPKGTEKEVMQKYQQLNAALLKTGRSIDLIRLDGRGAWTFENDLGIVILLGKDQLMERMQSLVSIVTHLVWNHQLEAIERIDMRYSNGAAVSWKQALSSRELMKNSRELTKNKTAMQTNNLEISESFNRKREQKL